MVETFETSNKIIHILLNPTLHVNRSKLDIVLYCTHFLYHGLSNQVDWTVTALVRPLCRVPLSVPVLY